MQAKPKDLGPQINPNKIEVGKEYYISMLDKPVTKVIVTGRIETPPEFRLMIEAVKNSGYVGMYPRFPSINPTDPWKTDITKYYEVLDLSYIKAQANVLRNLGRYGKIPMNITMHKLPGYLGLGGRSRRVTRYGRRVSVRKRRTYKS